MNATAGSQLMCIMRSTSYSPLYRDTAKARPAMYLGDKAALLPLRERMVRQKSFLSVMRSGAAQRRLSLCASCGLAQTHLCTETLRKLVQQCTKVTRQHKSRDFPDCHELMSGTAWSQLMCMVRSSSYSTLYRYAAEARPAMHQRDEAELLPLLERMSATSGSQLACIVQCRSYSTVVQRHCEHSASSAKR